MTTIAYRNGVMAADRRCSYKGGVEFALTKVARRSDGALIGGCGSAARFHAYMAWFLAGEHGEAPSLGAADDETECLVVYPDGRIENRTTLGVIHPVVAYVAMGTGRAYALAAMDMGAGPERAVEIACGRDVYSGDGIDAVSRDEDAWVITRVA